MLKNEIQQKLLYVHLGPLLDIEGPGSVFYMIRARERSRLRLQAHRKERQDTRQNRQNHAHVHSIRLPQSLVMAAQMAGAIENETEPQFEFSVTSPKTDVVKPNLNKEISIVANENNAEGISMNSNGNEKLNANTNNKNDKRSSTTEDLPNDSSKKVIRYIQSASKSTSGRTKDAERHNGAAERNDECARSLPSSPTLKFERRKTEVRLQTLENKVAEWLKKDNPRAAVNVSKLRRVQIEVTLRI